MEEQLFQSPAIQTPPVSPLSDIGYSKPRLSRPWWIAIFCVGGCAAILLFSTIFFSSAFPLPANTFILTTARPSILARALTPEQVLRLPSEWRTTIAQKSGWPVIFGLVKREGSNPQAFVLGPRWSIPASNSDQRNKFLVRQAGATSLPIDASSTPMVYRFFAFSHLVHAGWLQGWIDPSLLFPAAAASSTLIHFHTDGTTLQLTDEQSSIVPPAQRNLVNAPLPLNGDLSLQLAALTDAVQVSEVLNQLPIGPIDNTLPFLTQSPSAIDLSFSASSTLNGLRLTFTEPLSSQEQSTLANALVGGSTPTPLTLADGTLATEHVAHPTDVITPTSTLFTWTAASTTALSSVKPCSSGIWIARLSPQLLSRLLPSNDTYRVWLPSHALQFWRNHQTLIVCREL